jgi:hypothetical protein
MSTCGSQRLAGSPEAESCYVPSHSRIWPAVTAGFSAGGRCPHSGITCGSAPGIASAIGFDKATGVIRWSVQTAITVGKTMPAKPGTSHRARRPPCSDAHKLLRRRARSYSQGRRVSLRWFGGEPCTRPGPLAREDRPRLTSSVRQGKGTGMPPFLCENVRLFQQFACVFPISYHASNQGWYGD